jgi:hypothetical protein
MGHVPDGWRDLSSEDIAASTMRTDPAGRTEPVSTTACSLMTAESVVCGDAKAAVGEAIQRCRIPPMANSAFAGDHNPARLKPLYFRTAMDNSGDQREGGAGHSGRARSPSE